MAKKSSINRNNKRIIMAARQAPIRKELRAKTLDLSLSPEEREAAAHKLHKLPKNGAPIRVRRRCQFTGRSRGIYKKFMISRIVFREMAHRGLIPGVTKSSW